MDLIEWHGILPIRPICQPRSTIGTSAKELEFRASVRKFLDTHRPARLLSGPVAMSVVFQFHFSITVGKLRRASCRNLDFDTHDRCLDTLMAALLDAIKGRIVSVETSIWCQAMSAKVMGDTDAIYLRLWETGDNEDMRQMIEAHKIACARPCP